MYRSIKFIWVTLLIAAIIAGCGGGGDSPGGYTISGVVTNSANGLGIKNVVLNVSDHGTVTTAANGSWSVSGLSGSVTVTTPTLPGWTFDQTSRTVSAAASNLNFSVTFGGIQQAIDAVPLHGSATIVVPPGTYDFSANSVSINSKIIHLKSTDPDDAGIVAATVITGKGVFISYSSGPADQSIVEGFTIRGSSDNIYSGVSVAFDGNAIIRKNIIENCGNHGIAITSVVTNPIVVSGNTIRNNSANSGCVGNGIYVVTNDGSSVQITGNAISGNKGGMYLLSNGVNNTITINNNTISNNTAYSGGGIYVLKGTLTLDGNTITNNSATGGGGGGLSIASGSNVTVASTAFSGNTGTPGKVAYVSNNSILTLNAGNTYTNGNAITDIYYQP